MMHSPIKVITVEREYGSRGGEFAHDLAAKLGWRLLDSELVCGAARIAGVDPKLAAKFDERLDPWYYRYGKVFWHDSGYSMASIGDEHIFDSERMLALIKQQILDAAKEGNCVLVGRGAACALAGQPGCFHVFVYATASAKRDWFVQAFPQPCATCRPAAGRLRQAPRRGHPQVLSAGVVLPRPLPHAVELLHGIRADDRSRSGCRRIGNLPRTGSQRDDVHA